MTNRMTKKTKIGIMFLAIFALAALLTVAIAIGAPIGAAEAADYSTAQSGAIIGAASGGAGAHKSFCIGWLLFIFDCITCVGFIGFLASKRKREFGLAGICASGAALIFGIIAICVHQCAIAIVALVLAVLIFVAFMIAFLKKAKEAPAKKEIEEDNDNGDVDVDEILSAPGKENGYYRITEDASGKCTFMLFDEEGDHLSREMGVFESEKAAREVIALCRNVGDGAPVENRIGEQESIPEPKFVLDVSNKGVYRYTLFDVGGKILLQSVQYLNEKRCVVDLKKTLLCITTDETRLAEGKVALLGHQGAILDLLQAARIAGMIAINLVVQLLAGQHELIGIDHDDIIATVTVRGEGGLMLAAQHRGDLGSQAAHNHALSVDDVPLALDVLGICHITIHGKFLQI